MNTSSSSSSSKVKPISAPKFQLPDDFFTTSTDGKNSKLNDRYELWAMRMPVDFDVSNLHGISLSCDASLLNNDDDGKNGGGGVGVGSVLSSFEYTPIDPTNPTEERNDEHNAKKIKYSMVVGHPSESSTYRILLPKPDSDSETMVPLPIPFRKHLNVVRMPSEELTEIDLAPSKERAPEPVVGEEGEGGLHGMRVAYAPIPQVKGLKRRWNMFGANADVGVIGKGMESKRAKVEGGGGGENKSPSPSKKKESKSSSKKKAKKKNSSGSSSSKKRKQ